MTTTTATTDLNLDLLALGGVLGKTLRRRPELGRVGEAKVSLISGFWVTLHHEEERKAAALLAWFGFLAEPTLETRTAQGEDFPLTHVFVRGRLDDVPMSVLATFTGEDARRELGAGRPTPETLTRLQSVGAR